MLKNLSLRKTKNFFTFQKFNISQNITINFQNSWILKEIKITWCINDR